jgi:hypothetical protein
VLSQHRVSLKFLASRMLAARLSRASRRTIQKLKCFLKLSSRLFDNNLFELLSIHQRLINVEAVVFKMVSLSNAIIGIYISTTRNEALSLYRAKY